MAGINTNNKKIIQKLQVHGRPTQHFKQMMAVPCHIMNKGKNKEKPQKESKLDTCTEQLLVHGHESYHQFHRETRVSV